MSRYQAQGGFSLISAIFVIVVLAGVVGYMFQVSSVQLGTVGQGIAGERAYQVAQGGVQWAVRYAMDNDSGNPHADASASCSTIDGAGFTLNGHTVTMDCATYLFSDPGERAIYHITATASRGTPGTQDYVSRAVRATFALPSP
jgi:MSHA biogenesis protein MshP